MHGSDMLKESDAHLWGVAVRSTQRNRLLHRRNFNRALRLEGLEPRQLLANDLDDSLSEATSISGQISTTPVVLSGTINPDTDVDMYRFSVGGGNQVVD